MQELRTPLTDLLGTRTPIVSAAMAGVSSCALATQVALAGAFGFISPMSPESLDSDLEAIRTALNIPAGERLPIGAGFLGWMLDTKENLVACLDGVLRQRVKAIWLSFGDNLDKWVQYVRNRDPGVLIWIVVNSVQEAEHAVKEWQPDVLVVQGIEAGGHGRKNALPLLTLLPSIRRTIPNSPPLVAAGGLANGAHVAAVLTLGAAGAALGTRFAATFESAATSVNKEVLVAATETVRSFAYDEVKGTPWPDGINGRAVPNKINEDASSGLSIEERQKLYQEAVKNKDSSRSIVWAGASVGMVTEICSAGDIVRSIHDELVSQLSGKPPEPSESPV